MFAPNAQDWGYVFEASQNLCECAHNSASPRMTCVARICARLTVMSAVVTHIAGVEYLIHILKKGSQRLRTACHKLASAAQ